MCCDKRLVEAYIDENGKHPITGEPMSKDDLLAVVTTKTSKPRPPSATSIPGILSLLQGEWDALMLETHAYKQQIESLRQELSHSLYQHDASLRVISRLIKERDEAVQAARNVQANGIAAAPTAAPARAAAASSSGALPGLSSDHVAAIDSASKRLSKARKDKKSHPNLVKKEGIAEYSNISSHPLHKASHPGINTIDIDGRNDHIIATGGVDGDVVLFNKTNQEVVAKLSGHKKEVTSVRFHSSEDIIASSSRDNTVKLWRPSGDGKYTSAAFADHTSDVTGVSFHPCGNLMVTSSLDKTWMLHDINRGQALTKSDSSVAGGYTSTMIHPDGQIMGTGSVDGIAHMWDVKKGDNIARFTHLEGCAITSLCFSENGYYLATAADDNVVRVWDLRKQKQVTGIELGEGVSVSSARFDKSGVYLGIASTDVRVIQAKTWDTVKVLNDHSAHVTDVCFGVDAKYIASTSMDRTMKLYGAEAMDVE
uniref:Pre-mRNA-processing factor 19 n=1 Tax=Palpitomonas bilix TaxID=652834 RepID=A0A7S3GIX9_9EUKA|mmetsp:Transcript_551/g.1137  ORF Transcript_551/g.1137 Transcript_551/m.1137 type:complete len:482 (-) Transcript_551:70-1515(-)